MSKDASNKQKLYEMRVLTRLRQLKEINILNVVVCVGLVMGLFRLLVKHKQCPLTYASCRH